MSDLNRYIRQINLNNFGLENQQKLQKSKVLVVGAGGLGCPVLKYLTAAGIGTIGIIDFDKVELTNLHRQILFDENSIGKYKAKTAAEKLKQLNSEVNFNIYNEILTLEKAWEIFQKYDIIVDGTDNIPTRYLINDVSFLLNKPVVFASIYKYEGQIVILNVEDSTGKKCTYRDLYHSLPTKGEISNCKESGVLGVLPGIIGSMQANEVIKFICGLGNTLINRLLTYNILNHSLNIFEVRKNSLAKNPINKEELLKNNYDIPCNNEPNLKELKTVEEVKQVSSQPDTLLVDIRDTDELPRIKEIPHRVIPLFEIYDYLDELENYKQIIFLCQTSTRSLEALQILKNNLPQIRTYYVQGGITQVKI